MFYHIEIGITGMTSWLEKNLTKEDALLNYVCPFISKEITLADGEIMNMSSYGSMTLFSSDRPIDSDWPVSRKEIEEEGSYTWRHEYESKILEKLRDREETESFFKEAISRIEEGGYRNYRDSLRTQNKSRSVFMICPFGNEEVDHNYEFVISPAVERLGYSIARVDQISHTQTITEKILELISGSLFLIADLTEAKPNCYYEVGYAHALNKPVILLAKEGTTRHFDISTYKWNYWKDYKDLKPKLDLELDTLVKEHGT